MYDRAALISLPPEMRGAYAEHLSSISNGAAQFLTTVDCAQPGTYLSSQWIKVLNTLRVHLLHQILSILILII